MARVVSGNKKLISFEINAICRRCRGPNLHTLRWKMELCLSQPYILLVDMTTISPFVSMATEPLGCSDLNYGRVLCL